MKYRGIENLWGNVWEYVDGIKFYEDDIYICSDPSGYNSKNEFPIAPYFLMGKRPMVDTYGIVKTLSPLKNGPLLLYASENNADSTNSNYCDRRFFWNMDYPNDLCVGGNWNYSTGAGLWHYYEWIYRWEIDGSKSSRLCFKPIDDAEVA